MKTRTKILAGFTGIAAAIIAVSSANAEITWDKKVDDGATNIAATSYVNKAINAVDTAKANKTTGDTTGKKVAIITSTGDYEGKTLDQLGLATTDGLEELEATVAGHTITIDQHTATISGLQTAVDTKQDKLGGDGKAGQVVVGTGTAGIVEYKTIDGTVSGTSDNLITSKAVANAISTAVSGVTTDVNGKADKVTAAVENNLAGLDATGNLKDSGVAASAVTANTGAIAGLTTRVGTAESKISTLENATDTYQLKDNIAQDIDTVAEGETATRYTSVAAVKAAVAGITTNVDGKADLQGTGDAGFVAEVDANGQYIRGTKKTADLALQSSVDTKATAVATGTGTGTKVTVNAQGIVTKTEAAGISDITNLEAELKAKQGNLGGGDNADKVVVGTAEAGTVTYKAIDTTVAAESTNLITSGAVHTAIGNIVTNAVEGLGDLATQDTVHTGQIDAGIVGTTELAAAAVTTDKIAVDAVTNVKIADTAVTTDKIADGNVTANKIKDAAVTNVKIADTAVTTAKIADANVTADKIATDAVTTAKIANANVTKEKLATDVQASLVKADTAVQATGMTSNLIPAQPANCANGTNRCALLAKNNAFVWEIVID